MGEAMVRTGLVVKLTSKVSNASIQSHSSIHPPIHPPKAPP